MGELAARDDVDWQAVQEVHDQWSKSDSGIGGPGMQLVSLAMAVALSWTGVGATAGTAIANSVGLSGNAAMTAAFTAGFDSLITQAGMQVIANGGDVGAALKAMASIDTVRSLTTAMLTAGLSSEALGSFGESDLAKGIDGLAKDLAENTIKAGINTGVGTAINGGNLGENLIADLRGAAVSVLGAEVAHDIGAAYAGGTGDLDYVSHKIAHAALGGAMAAANGGDIASGAIGGIVGEMTGELLMEGIEKAMLTGDIDPSDAQKWIDAGVDLSKLAAGLAVVATGGDIDAAANAGENAVRNNCAQACQLIMEIEIMAPIVIATAVALYQSGLVSLEDVNTKLREGAAELKTLVIEKYEALTDDEKQQFEIPGYDATEIDIALGGIPGDTDHNDSPSTTPDNGEVADSGTVSEDQSGQVDDSGVVAEVEFKIEPKIEKQAKKRGWTEDSIGEVIVNPERTVETRDTRWNDDSRTKRDDPATAYIDTDGNYVVRNDVDGTIVQVSDKNDPNWVAPF